MPPNEARVKARRRRRRTLVRGTELAASWKRRLRETFRFERALFRMTQLYADGRGRQDGFQGPPAATRDLATRYPAMVDGAARQPAQRPVGWLGT